MNLPTTILLLPRFMCGRMFSTSEYVRHLNKIDARFGFWMCVCVVHGVRVCVCICRIGWFGIEHWLQPTYLQWANKMRTMIHFDFGFNANAHDARTNEKTRAMEKHVAGIFRSLIVNYMIRIRFGPLQMDDAWQWNNIPLEWNRSPF